MNSPGARFDGSLTCCGACNAALRERVRACFTRGGRGAVSAGPRASGFPRPPSLPYKVNTSRPSLRSKRTRLVPPSHCSCAIEQAACLATRRLSMFVRTSFSRPGTRFPRWATRFPPGCMGAPPAPDCAARAQQPSEVVPHRSAALHFLARKCAPPLVLTGHISSFPPY